MTVLELQNKKLYGDFIKFQLHNCYNYMFLLYKPKFEHFL